MQMKSVNGISVRISFSRCRKKSKRKEETETKKTEEIKGNHSYDNAKCINCIVFDGRCLMLMEIILTFCSFYSLTALHIHFRAHHIQFAFFSPLWEVISERGNRYGTYIWFQISNTDGCQLKPTQAYLIIPDRHFT